jgi:hypothetical protein
MNYSPQSSSPVVPLGAYGNRPNLFDRSTMATHDRHLGGLLNSGPARRQRYSVRPVRATSQNQPRPLVSALSGRPKGINFPQADSLQSIDSCAWPLSKREWC